MFLYLTAKQRRHLALGLLVLALLLIMWLLIMPFIVETKSYSDQQADLRFQLSKYQQAISHKEELKRQLSQFEEKLKSERLYYEGDAQGVVAASIQDKIRQEVDASQGNLISTQILPEKKGEQFTRMLISARLTGSDQVLQKLLQKLELSRPLLTVEKVTIIAKRRPRNVNSPVKPLNITLDVAGYLVKGSK